MKNKKYIVWSVASVLVIAWLAFGYLNFMGASANPDYICIKNVNKTCSVDETNCSEWDSTTWTRTCEWTRVSKVAYYHTRTSCESWYTWIRGGWFTGWASWRKSADFTYASENCQIEQVDKTRPGWEVEQID